MFNQPATHKKVLETFRRIDELSKKQSLRIELPNSPLNGKQIEVWKSDNYFEFSLDLASRISSGYSSVFDSWILIGKDKNYSFLKDSYHSGSIDFENDKTKGKLTSIIESSDSSELTTSYLRLIQPIKGYAKIAYIEGAVILKPDHNNSSSFGLNQFTIESFELDVFKVDVEKQRFIIIDSRSKIDLEKFKNITDAFFAGYAFVFEDIVGEEAYFLSSDNYGFEKISRIIFNTKPASYFGNSYPIFERNMPLHDDLIY